MKSLFNTGAYTEIKIRLHAISETTERQWEQMEYKLLDHHLRQFGA